jgi:hypothetical protein
LATLSMRSRTELMFQVVTVNRIGIGISAVGNQASERSRRISEC